MGRIITCPKGVPNFTSVAPVFRESRWYRGHPLLYPRIGLNPLVSSHPDKFPCVGTGQWKILLGFLNIHRVHP